MSAPYKKVLLVGATSGNRPYHCFVLRGRALGLSVGIGHGLACKYAETGTHVVAVGRRQQQLYDLAKQYEGKISTIVFDIAKLDEIPKFVDKVVAEHPDLECVFLNR